MSRREVRSLLTLFVLAVAGHLLRAALLAPVESPGAISLFDPVTDGDPLAQKKKIEALMRPLGADERVDVDRATSAELQRLPGVGPALAARIVADRESRGAYGSVAGLDRVPGIGAGTLARLGPHLQFSGTPADTSNATPNGQVIDLNQATVPELDALPGIGVARARAIVAFRDSVGPFRQVDELLRVPGLTRRIVDRIAARLVLR